MARSIRQGFNIARAHVLSQPRWVSSQSSEALVEVKVPGFGMISRIPEKHLRRRVIIYSPARTASQQGSGKVGRWRINFLSTQKWENPLMGWTSTGDPYANVGEAGLTFESEEAAKEFAQKHGWDNTVCDSSSFDLSAMIELYPNQTVLEYKLQASLTFFLSPSSSKLTSNGLLELHNSHQSQIKPDGKKLVKTPDWGP